MLQIGVWQACAKEQRQASLDPALDIRSWAQAGFLDRYSPELACLKISLEVVSAILDILRESVSLTWSVEIDCFCTI